MVSIPVRATNEDNTDGQYMVLVTLGGVTVGKKEKVNYGAVISRDGIRIYKNSKRIG